MEKFKNWVNSTVKKAFIDNWSELLATLIAFYGMKVTAADSFEGFIFGITFWALTVYWLFYRFLGAAEIIKRYLKQRKNGR